MASHDFEYLIALGSNTGDRQSFLNQAVELIQGRIGPVTALSRIYETEPVGAADQMFLNAAIRVASNLPPDSVMASLLVIEENLGRVRTTHWGNRTIDLDILLVRTRNLRGQLVQAVVDTPALTVPHPEMLNRGFVLVPAAEVAGNWIHPKTNSTLAEDVAGRFNDLKPSQCVWRSQRDVPHLPGQPTMEAPAPTFI
jgi:2-amino-4-hydroxy-6-hydroxymethyldihydropteridine diphosphokinase